jgi:hypothetical protein
MPVAPEPGAATLKVDHVTIAGAELAKLEHSFAGVGLVTDYGGAHSNQITHMALLGFIDGSYIELISTIQPGQKETAFWGEHILGDGGPCAWAVQVGDVAAEAARVAALGIPVSGPFYYQRRRPNGVLVEWDLAFLDDKGAGAMLPFIINDITPRAWRVQPSASIANAPLTGVATVLLGIPNLSAAITLFRQVYDWPEPLLQEEPTLGARLAHFESSPVILAAPLAQQGELPARLARFGPSPWGYCLGTTDFEAACVQFKLTPAARWFNRPVAWFDSDRLHGIRLGLIGG